MTAQTPLDSEDLEALSVASALIRARSELGITQAQLAELSGVSRSAIKGYETGRNMPGSRELKSLCRALRVSPNSLLFGTESPVFGEPDDSDEARLLSDVLSEPEGKLVARARLAYLASLLTHDETTSLLNLVQSLATARHGPDLVKQTVLGADMIAGMFHTMLTEAAHAKRDGRTVDAEAFAKGWESFLNRQGHVPKKQTAE